MEPDFGIGHVHFAIHARAMKVQGVAAPFAAETVLGGERVGGLLHERLRLQDRQRMGFD